MYALQDAPLAITHGAWGRGLRATRAIQAGETLLIDDAYVRVLRTTEAVHRWPLLSREGAAFAGVRIV